MDVPLVVTGAALTLAALSAAAAPKRPCGTYGTTEGCEGFLVGGFDEWAVGPRAHAADFASDVTRALAFSAPLVLGGYSLFDLRPRARDGAAGIAADMLVLGEALAITAGLTGLLKDAVGRRRPWAYDRGDTELPSDDFRSFPSGHASAAFAAVSAACVTFVRRHAPRPLLAVAACGPGYALAGGTAFLRVEAGAHFPSDVLIGALVGTAVGVGVPLLHADPRGGGVRLGVVPVPGGMAFALQGFR